MLTNIYNSVQLSPTDEVHTYDVWGQSLECDITHSHLFIDVCKPMHVSFEILTSTDEVPRCKCNHLFYN